MPQAPLEDARVNTKTTLAALWASTTFCYIYGDYFELYIPGKLEAMLPESPATLPAMSPDPAIEKTSRSRLRRLRAAAHGKRWTSSLARRCLPALTGET